MTTTPEDDDLVAAEYVLGTLDLEERLAAARRIESEPAFARVVEGWTARLSPLAEGGRDIEPPGDLWPRLLRRLGWTDAPRADVVVSFERRVRRWQAVAAASTALAAGLAVFALATVFDRPARQTSTLVAVLQASDAPPVYLIRADLGDRRLSVRPVAAKPPAGKIYELWIIDPALGNPRSLGVLADEPAPRTLPPDIASDVASRATYAITVEPPGGAPGGKPSGAPVFIGHLLST